MLGIAAAMTLTFTVVQLKAAVLFIPIYIIFSIFWMFDCLLAFLPFDGGTPPGNVPIFQVGLLMGAFGGLFTTAPAIASMMSANTDGATLRESI